MEHLYSDITPETAMRKERVIRMISNGINMLFKASDEFLEKTPELSCDAIYRYHAERKIAEGQRLLKEVFFEY